MMQDDASSWLNNIPAHWEVKRLKHIGKSTTGLTYSPDDIVVEGQGTAVLRANNLQRNTVVLDDLVHVSSNIPKKLQLEKGDIVICSRNGSRALIGKNATVGAEHVGLTFGAFTTSFRTPSYRFIGWVLNSSLFAYQAGAFLTSTINQLTLGTLNNFQVPFPDLDTQKTIADFLDRETARIDQLIEKKEAMRLVVEERLRASIACAVTSCDAEESQPLRRYCKVVTGKTPSRAEESNFSQEVGIPWATPSDLGFLTPIGSTKEQITETGMVGMPSVSSGTTLVNGIGASVGKVGIAGVELTFNQQIHALFQRTASFDDRYLFFSMLMRKDEIVSMASNTTIPIINSERLGRLVLARPTMETQQRVRSKLDAEASRARQLEHKLETSIVGLRQYRTSLITAAVTGQIDVTTWGKQGSTDRRLDQIEEEMRVG